MEKNIFVKPNSARIISRLEAPQGKKRVIIDSDAYNEIDDQFAIIYAMLSLDEDELISIYAAPFFNEKSNGAEDGMEKSYDEILRIMKLFGSNMPVYKGSKNFMTQKEAAVPSAAAEHLIKTARQMPADEPLYVVAIGAITNIASALLQAPDIADKLVVLWLGSNALHLNDQNEFNLRQDTLAAQVVFDSGVPLVIAPCLGVSSHLVTTLPEVTEYLSDSGALGAYLCETYRGAYKDHFGRSRVIWDIAPLAYLLHPEATTSTLAASPIVCGQTLGILPSRHLVRYLTFIDRDIIFKDFFEKVRGAKPLRGEGL